MVHSFFQPDQRQAKFLLTHILHYCGLPFVTVGSALKNDDGKEIVEHKKKELLQDMNVFL
jgi:hypothetical protein